MPVFSVLVGLLLLEFALDFYHSRTDREYFQSTKRLAVNSPDRSYWYYIRKIGPDGSNQANSYGFLGPEPHPNPGNSKIRALLIGDSMPGAGRPVNFPKIAEVLYKEETGKQIEIVNASIHSYSTEQIKRYYKA